jgi:23S rRNA pseudouridine2605 synthase
MNKPTQDDSRSSKPPASARSASNARATQAVAPGESVYKAIALADVVSGQFDIEEESQELGVDLGKRVLAPQTDSPKLHKVLAQAGMGSRLEMEKLIAEGRIMVNNEPAHVGQRVQYGDQIKVNGKPIHIRIDPPPARVIAYHKPAGEIVSHDDPQNRPSVFRKLPRLQNGKWQSVGRLDLNTEGLLLFTSSGELANQLMHPRFGLEREYAVRVLGALSKDEKQKLLDGVNLDDGPAQFGSIEDGGGEGSNCWYRVTISEGRNREVRRMFEAVGHAVSRLIRIRYGAVMLPRGLKRGAFVELDDQDIAALTNALIRSEGRGDQRSARQRPAGGPGGRGQRRERPADSRGPRRPDAYQPDTPRPPVDQQLHDAETGETLEPYDLQPPPMRQDGGRGAGRGPRGPGPGGPRGGQRQGPGGGAGQGQQRRGDRKPRPDGPPAGAQPDPMKTSFGYIGAETFTRQRQAQGQRRPGGGGGGGPRRGGSGNRGGGAGGGGRGGNR